MKKRIVILGSTGSIGVSALDVIARHPDKFEVLALTAKSNVAKLAEQARRFKPKKTIVADRDGMDAVIEAATDPEADIVLSAIVGAAGLKPTYSALKAGKTVALANKESLVAAGAVMIRATREGGAALIPVDSEHSAIHQVLNSRLTTDDSRQEIVRLILTASGGPFRTHTAAQLEKVTVEEALKHPKWNMGAKITIDSATLMNKGLEIIEAHWLFNMPPQKIAVKVHPQSIVHSLVEYVDGSVLAQLGNPDMRTPIAYALAWPERIATPVAPLDLTAVSPLTFEEPDTARFPCLALARQALEMGGSAPCVLNAANEVAVAAFLEGKIGFRRIPAVIEEVLKKLEPAPLNSLEDVVEMDTWARALCDSTIARSHDRTNI